MRTLSSTLTTAVNAQTRRPAISLSAEDHIHHLNQTITTSGNADGWSDICVASDGGIVRVQVTHASGPASYHQTFQWQRVTDPTSATQWQTWTTFSGSSAVIWQDALCAVSNNSGILRAFAQQGTGGVALWCWTSNDNGVSWSGPVTVLTLPYGALIHGMGSAGQNDLFFLYDVYGGVSVGACFYSGGWGSLVTSPLPLLFSGYGIAPIWNSTTGLYTLIYSDTYVVYAASYAPGAHTWTALPIVAPSTSDAIVRRSPRLALLDGVYHLTYIEIDFGGYTGTTYNHPRVRQSLDLQNWSTGFILHDMPTFYAANLLTCTPPTTTHELYVAVTAGVVELDMAFSSANPAQYIDLSTYVLEYRREEEPGKPASLNVVLDNSLGMLNSSVTVYGAGSYKPIGLNTTLILSEGYYTGSPPTTRELMRVGKYNIKEILLERAPGSSHLRLIAEDASYLLDQVNRYQISTSNTALQTLLQQLCSLAGLLSFQMPVSAQMTENILTFVLHAGQKYRQGLDELCRLGWLEYFLDEYDLLHIKELSVSDPVVWTYSPEIATLVLGSDDSRANHIIVTGKPPALVPGVFPGSITNAEVFDDLHMHTTGVERIAMYTDLKLSTSTLCNQKAAFLLQQEQRVQIAHNIVIPVNPALQLLDVLSLSDQSAALSGTSLTVTARIYRQEVLYTTDPPVYEQTLFLEGI